MESLEKESLSEEPLEESESVGDRSRVAWACVRSARFQVLMVLSLDPVTSVF